MPQRYIKRKKNNRGKSAVKRRKRYTNASSFAITTASPMGNKLKRTLRYADRAMYLNPGAAGIAATHVFSCNGLYDCDVTGVGHQPLGFDQIMTMFHHYTVIGARIKCDFYNSDTSYSQMVGIRVGATSTTQNDYRVYVENGREVYKTLGPAGSSRDTCTITKTCSVSKFMGRKNILSEDDFRGDSSSNPNEQCFFEIWAAPSDGVDTSPVAVNVLIEFITIFTEPNTLALS